MIDHEFAESPASMVAIEPAEDIGVFHIDVGMSMVNAVRASSARA